MDMSPHLRNSIILVFFTSFRQKNITANYCSAFSENRPIFILRISMVVYPRLLNRHNRFFRETLLITYQWTVSQISEEVVTSRPRPLNETLTCRLPVGESVSVLSSET
jgi:hypothetical protein